MIELIPAIDIINGQCVRLTKGDYDQKTIYGSPLEMAQEFERIGFNRLHMVDSDGAKSKHIVNSDVLRSVTTKTRLTFEMEKSLLMDVRKTPQKTSFPSLRNILMLVSAKCYVRKYQKTAH